MRGQFEGDLLVRSRPVVPVACLVGKAPLEVAGATLVIMMWVLLFRSAGFEPMSTLGCHTVTVTGAFSPTLWLQNVVLLRKVIRTAMGFFSELYLLPVGCRACCRLLPSLPSEGLPLSFVFPIF